MPIPLYWVDAFTDQPFAGNPAAVCLLDEEKDPAWMQRVAAEMNLSETAFVRPVPGGFSLRWFTPAVEVELCGHATLASAHVLGEIGTQADQGGYQSVLFKTQHAGDLTCVREQDTGLIAMDFPADPPEEAEPPEGLAEALGVKPVRVARGRYDWLLELADERAVLAAEPDFKALARFETRGIIVTARGDDERIDVVSRFFAPRYRVDEDPVTGSAHCVLGPYWRGQLGKDTLECVQASRRGGRLRVVMGEDEGRVKLAGQAVTVAAGELRA